jgi:4-diphosphocytidyl-2-C-methyl-D-erythritol kinase
MGGGSADAAATLRVLDQLWGTGLDDRALAEVAVGIGSDVPALLAGEPVFARGKGEHVVPVHMPSTWWVIRPFPFGVRTPDAFAWWDRDGETGPDPGVLVAAAEAGNANVLGLALFNDLQAPVCARHPEVAETIAAFEDAGALGVVMTGSGPTVAALAQHLGHADRLAAAVPGSFVTGGPPPAAASVPHAG